MRSKPLWKRSPARVKNCRTEARRASSSGLGGFNSFAASAGDNTNATITDSTMAATMVIENWR